MSDNEFLIRLDNMGEILANVGNKICTNQNLLKCIAYDQPDALSQPDIKITDKNNIDVVELIGKGNDPKNQQRIFKFLIDKYIIETVRSELRFGIPKIQPENRYIAKLPITFQIIIHNSLLELNDNKMRPFIMINELLKDLNGNIDDIKGIGGLELSNPIIFHQFNNNFSGYVVFFETRTV